ncbi:MAG: hypothetical protein V4538_12810 [Bacteroidota bacterium]
MINYKRISIYTYTALVILVIGIVTKLFLVDTDMGSRFRNFNHQFLVSDFIFILAAIIFLLGQLFRVIKQNKKSTITDKTILIHLMLLMPLLFTLVSLPFLETFMPNQPLDDSIVSSVYKGVVIVAILGYFTWIVLFVITMVRQVFYILIKKD